MLIKWENANVGVSNFQENLSDWISIDDRVLKHFFLIVHFNLRKTEQINLDLNESNPV